MGRSRTSFEEAATVMRRRHRRDAQNQTERRVLRALQFVQMGELSSAMFHLGPTWANFYLGQVLLGPGLLGPGAT